MTSQKHLKSRVRSRMAKTGESYAAAREHVVAATAPQRPQGNSIRHFPGIHPETTALRILATHAGLPDVTEETALAAGGGLGAGVFAFHYEKEGFSSLFLAGRNGWEDGRPFMESGARRLGLEPTIVETGSQRSAAAQLMEALERGPVAVWVDSVSLPYRAAPQLHEGGGYHVIVVYAIDGDEALVADLFEEPVRIATTDLARARARIAKQKHRLLSVAAATGRGPTRDVAAAEREGLAAGAERLATEPRRNFSLAAFEDLARRMHGSTAADSWSRVFPRGRLLWTGLSSLHRFVETYFTGGGLLRPMGARAIAETASRSGDGALAGVAARYERLGSAWADLANAALPEAVPLLGRTRRIQEQMTQASSRRGIDAAPHVRAAWGHLDELAAEAERDFPLGEAETDRLLAELAERLRAIHAQEVDALSELRAALADRKPVLAG
jgi:hypothetical protein